MNEDNDAPVDHNEEPPPLLSRNLVQYNDDVDDDDLGAVEGVAAEPTVDHNEEPQPTSQPQPQATTVAQVANQPIQTLAKSTGTNTRKLGQAESTRAGRASSEFLYDAFAVAMLDLPKFADLTWDDVEADNLQEIYRLYATGLATVPVPHGFDSNLQSNSKKILNLDTLVQRFTTWNAMMKEKFRGHEAYPSRLADNAEFYTPLIADMKREYKRNLKEWQKDPDLLVGHRSVWALYPEPLQDMEIEEKIDLSTWAEDESTPGPNKDIEQLFSLEYVCRSLFKKMDPSKPRTFSEPLLVLATYYGVGRGGEAKFLNYSRMAWINYLQLFDTKWVQAKTVQDGAMGMAMSRQKIYECFLCVFAIFISIGRGLERTPQHKKKKVVNFMFPNEHSVRSSETSRKIGNILKAQLPKNAPKHMKDGVTAKSLRCGAISAISMAPGMGVFDVCGRSGHKTGTNIDSYFDQNCVERTMPGGNILFGNKGKCKVPLIESLPVRMKPSLERMYNNFSLTWDVPAFLPGGHLQRLGRNSLALMIMRHNELEDLEGPNHAVVRYMKDLAVKSNLRDPSNPEDHPENVLEECSRLLFDLHNARNFQTPDPDLSDIGSMLASVQQSLSWDRKRNEESMVKFQETVMGRLATIEKEVRSVKSIHREENSLLKSRIHHLEQKLVFLKSPPTSPQKRIPSFSQHCGYDTPQMSTSSSVASAAPKTQPPPAPKPTSSSVVNVSHVSNMNVAAPTLNAASSNGTTFVGMQISTTTGQPPISDGGKATSNTETGRGEEMSSKPAPKPSGEANITHISQLTRATKNRRPAKLVWNNQAKVDKRSGTARIFDIIIDLHSSGFFHQRPYDNKGCHECCLSQKWMFFYVMELLDFSLTDEQRAFLHRKQPIVDRKAHEMYHSIVNGMMDQMWIFEGLDPVVTRKVQETKSGTSCKATFTAVAHRILKYKQDIRKGLKLEKKAKVGLMNRGDIPAPGTPKGNKSIRRCFDKTTAAGKENNKSGKKRDVGGAGVVNPYLKKKARTDTMEFGNL